jgi:Na+/H+ antiporter
MQGISQVAEIVAGVVALLLISVVTLAITRRLKLPFMIALVLVGMGLSALSGAFPRALPPLHNLEISSSLIFYVFLPTLVFEAAFNLDARQLRENLGSVLVLAIPGLLVSTALIGVIVGFAMPIPLTAALLLGAILSATDPVAVLAVFKRLGAPERLKILVEGESLFNDATALLTYRLAVAASITGTFSAWSAIPMLALVSAGSIGLGALLCRVSLFLTSQIEDIATAVISQFVSTFAVWMLAEALGLSGIITVVVFAILVARTAPDRIPARVRIPSYAVWEVTVFVLNVLAFILVGLQLKPILGRLGRAELVTYLGVAAGVTVAVILVRIVWVMGYAAVGRWLARRREPSAQAGRYPSFRTATVIAWCGMRGIVTLAAALALPARFPYRDLILFTAFSVVLGTLVVQGMTVSPLMRVLKLRDDHTVQREVRLARAETARAGLAAVDGAESGNEMVRLLQRKYRARMRRAESAGGVRPGPSDDDDGGADYWSMVRRAQAAERRTLSELRARGVIGDDAFHRVEEELDFADMNADAMTRGE